LTRSPWACAVSTEESLAFNEMPAAPAEEAEAPKEMTADELFNLPKGDAPEDEEPS